MTAMNNLLHNRIHEAASALICGLLDAAHLLAVLVRVRLLDVRVILPAA